MAAFFMRVSARTPPNNTDRDGRDRGSVRRTLGSPAVAVHKASRPAAAPSGPRPAAALCSAPVERVAAVPGSARVGAPAERQMVRTAERSPVATWPALPVVWPAAALMTQPEAPARTVAPLVVPVPTSGSDSKVPPAARPWCTPIGNTDRD